jgi:hypothetical protein
LLLTANIFDHAARVRSFELAIRACTEDLASPGEIMPGDRWPP